jgi:hypothetical protein
MEQPLAELRRAGPRVRAAPVDLILFPAELGAARRAVRRIDVLALVTGAQVGDRSEDLGNHVARLAQDYHVADEHALALDLVRVVQSGPVDRGPADLDRLHHGERSNPAGPPHVDLDVEQPGGDLFRRVLEGDGPPRCPAGRAELALQCDLVHLDHDAVDLVRRIVPVLPVVGDVRADPVHVRHHFVQRADGQAPLPQPLIPARLGIRCAFQVAFLTGPRHFTADALCAG